MLAGVRNLVGFYRRRANLSEFDRLGAGPGLAGARPRATCVQRGLEIPKATVNKSMHPLDHPVWNALISRQGALAEGGTLARRYPPEIAPFAQ